MGAACHEAPDEALGRDAGRGTLTPWRWVKRMRLGEDHRRCGSRPTQGRLRRRRCEDRNRKPNLQNYPRSLGLTGHRQFNRIPASWPRDGALKTAGDIPYHSSRVGTRLPLRMRVLYRYGILRRLGALPLEQSIVDEMLRLKERSRAPAAR